MFTLNRTKTLVPSSQPNSKASNSATRPNGGGAIGSVDDFVPIGPADNVDSFLSDEPVAPAKQPAKKSGGFMSLFGSSSKTSPPAPTPAPAPVQASETIASTKPKSVPKVIVDSDDEDDFSRPQIAGFSEDVEIEDYTGTIHQQDSESDAEQPPPIVTDPITVVAQEPVLTYENTSNSSRSNSRTSSFATVQPIPERTSSFTSSSTSLPVAPPPVVDATVDSPSPSIAQVAANIDEPEVVADSVDIWDNDEDIQGDGEEAVVDIKADEEDVGSLQEFEVKADRSPSVMSSTSNTSSLQQTPQEPPALTDADFNFLEERFANNVSVEPTPGKPLFRFLLCFHMKEILFLLT